MLVRNVADEVAAHNVQVNAIGTNFIDSSSRHTYGLDLKFPLNFSVWLVTTPTSSDTSPTPVTVLGLGAMGSAIARVFLEHGHPTTVWSRTASKATPLVEAGASTAATATEAAAASPLVVLCVLDYEAVDDVLDAVGDAVAGRTLVNVTSGAPDRARATRRWADQHGADYLDGGVMGDPPDLGSGHVMFLYSGSRTAFDAHEATLRKLGTPTC